jgi:hypothetical protein
MSGKVVGGAVCAAENAPGAVHTFIFGSVHVPMHGVQVVDNLMKQTQIFRSKTDRRRWFGQTSIRCKTVSKYICTKCLPLLR